MPGRPSGLGTTLNGLAKVHEYGKEVKIYTSKLTNVSCRLSLPCR
jgi:hypothetical protein